MSITIKDIKQAKNKKKISMLTAYSYPLAKIIDAAGIDIILVGDSLANVVLGMESTKEVTMSDMLRHTQAVTRAVEQALVIGDMPYEAYQEDIKVCVDNAKKFITAGCAAVKVEWFDDCIEVVKLLRKENIEVMAHIGLTPQTVEKLGGFKAQGKDIETAKKLINQAVLLEKEGCFAIVLECIPDRVAKLITEKISIPTIGIGSGSFCDGQVLVTHDMLGLFDRYTPKFVKKYADLSSEILKAVTDFKDEVSGGVYPDKEHSFSISDEEFEKLKQEI